MRLTEDPIVKIIPPEFKSEEEPEKYRLMDIILAHPPALDLVFFDTVNERVGRIFPRDLTEAIDIEHLKQYKRALELLRGYTWPELLRLDFKVGEDAP